MAVTITYNNSAPWGPNNVPYLTMDKEPIMSNGKMAQVTMVTLTGTLDAINQNLEQNFPDPLLFDGSQDDSTLDVAKNSILALFGDSFGEFLVTDPAAPAGQREVFYCANTIVENVDFPEQKYIGTLDWSVNLKCYEQGYFDDLGIVEKNDSFDMSKDASDVVTITHRIYARAVNRGTWCASALDTAKDFVENRRGLGNVGNTFIGINAAGVQRGPILTDEIENINRLEGTYEITETWKADPDDENDFEGSVGKVTIRHSVEIMESTFDRDFQEANVTYTFTGGKDTTNAEMRSAVNDITYQGAGNKMHTAAVNQGLTHHPISNSPFFWISEEPLDIAIEEDLANKTITKTGLFTNDPRWVLSGGLGLPVYFDHEVSIETNEITSVTTVSISATIGSIGPQLQQQSAITDFLENMGMDPNTGITDTGINDGGDSGVVGGAFAADGNLLTSAPGVQVVMGSIEALAQNHYHSYKRATDPKHVNYTGPDVAQAPQNLWALNVGPVNMQVTRDVERNQARISMSFTDEDMIEDYENVTYNISVEKPIVYRKSNPSANIDGHYSLTHFNGKKNADGIIEPMYTRQKHTIRANFSHKENRPVGSTKKQREALTRGEAGVLMNALDNLYLNNLPIDAEAYVVSENESHTSDLIESIDKTRVTSYHSNSPLINLPPDPNLNDCKTELLVGSSVNATSITVVNIDCIRALGNGINLVIAPGVAGFEEIVLVASTTPGSNVVSLSAPTLFAHSINDVVVAPGNGIGTP